MRAWDLVEGDGYGRDSIIVAETCHEVVVNAAIPPARFNISIITADEAKPERQPEGQTDGDDQR